IADVAPGIFDQMRQDVEFGKREIDGLALPDGAMGFVSQDEIAMAHESRLLHLALAPPAKNQFDALEQDREAPRLLHKIHRAVQQPGLFVDLIVEYCEEDHRYLDIAGAQALQHLDSRLPWHLPIQQDKIGRWIPGEMIESGWAVLEYARVIA